MPERLRLLVVAPHPDDNTFFYGGTVAESAQANIDTHVIVLTDGEKGSIALTDSNGHTCGARKPESSEIAEFKTLRQKEEQLAASYLGVTSVHLAHIPDREVKEQAIPLLRDQILAINPDVILCFGELGTTLHPDHSWSGIATYSAAISLMQTRSYDEYLRLARILTVTVPTAVGNYELYGEIANPAIPKTTINIQTVLAKKIAASRMYTSQAHLFKVFMEAGTLTDPSEYFIQRITRGDISPHPNNLWEGITAHTNGDIHIHQPMPLPDTSYLTNTPSSIELMKNRINKANAQLSLLYQYTPAL